MKNLLLALSLSLMSLTASAATLNIEEYDILYNGAQDVNTACQPCLPTPFDTAFDVNTLPYAYTVFTVTETHPSPVQPSSATFSQFNLLDSGNNVVSTALLDNLGAFSFAYQTLAETVYTLELFGDLQTSPVRVHLAGIAQTPIPAALWLFGPLMIGFLALRKRFLQ